MNNTLDVSSNIDDEENEVDPINDIIEYLVRCANISFKNAHVNQNVVSTSEKIKIACDIYKTSPTDFLIQFGKYLTPSHLKYFEQLEMGHANSECFKECLDQLKMYHSEESKRKRVRNRRYKALQKFQDETDYFSEKQMMSRNPLLYEQLIGQYLTDEEINERDGVDRENLTFLDLILETVDRNQMRETKNEQMIAESLDSVTLTDSKRNEDIEKEVKNNKHWGDFEDEQPKKRWGDFITPDARPSHKPETRKQTAISAPEKRLLKEEFLQEMYSSFIEGQDIEIDYHSIDNDEQYDDLQQLSQDAEDKYFDSVSNEVENLEEHMTLVKEYGQQSSHETPEEDPLDEFMRHISKRLNNSY